MTTHTHEHLTSLTHKQLLDIYKNELGGTKTYFPNKQALIAAMMDIINDRLTDGYYEEVYNIDTGEWVSSVTNEPVVEASEVPEAKSESQTLIEWTMDSNDGTGTPASSHLTVQTDNIANFYNWLLEEYRTKDSLKAIRGARRRMIQSGKPVKVTLKFEFINIKITMTP